MSITPGQQQPLGESLKPGSPTADGLPAGHPAPGVVPGPYQPAPAPKTSGLAIAGLVLSVMVFPVGFVISLIALFTAGRNGQRGRGLAVLGLVISLLITGGVVVFFAVVKDNVKNISTIADPGCIKGKEIILDNGDLSGGEDQMKAKLQAMITGMDSAAAAAKNADVQAAMKALGEDYRLLQEAALGGSQGQTDFEARIKTHADRIDELCTFGGAQE
jgi:hypothetical protein